MQIVKFILLGVITSVLGFFGFGQVVKLTTPEAPPQIDPTKDVDQASILQDKPLLKTLGILGAAIGLVLFLFRTQLRSFLSAGRVVAVGLSIWGLNQLLGGDYDYHVAILMGTIPAASVGQFVSQYLPQFIKFTSPLPLTSISVDVAGFGNTVNITDERITDLNKLFKLSTNAGEYLLQLADGTVREKNVTFRISNPNAAPMDIFGFGLNDANAYFLHNEQSVLVGGTVFENFAYLSGEEMIGTNDVITINYRDGFSQKWTVGEINEFSALFQNDTGVIINNTDGIIKSVVIEPVATRVIGVGRYAPLN